MSVIKLFLSEAGLLRNLVIKNFRSRYSNLLFGLFWTIFAPLLISLIISFVFRYIMPAQASNFRLYVISGMLPWMYFTSSLQESSASLVESASLLKQFRIPPEFAPAASVIVNFINLAAGLALSAVFLLHIPAQVAFCLALVFVPLALHFLFTLGISFMLSALYIKHRDIVHILNIVFLFWLWFSPVFYFIDSFPMHIKKIFNLNIIIPYLNLYRSVFYKQAFFEYRDLFLSICLSLLSLTCGYRFFIRTESSIKKAL